MKRKRCHNIIGLIDLHRYVSSVHCNAGKHLALIYKEMIGMNAVFAAEGGYIRTVMCDKIVELLLDITHKICAAGVLVNFCQHGKIVYEHTYRVLQDRIMPSVLTREKHNILLIAEKSQHIRVGTHEQRAFGKMLLAESGNELARKLGLL